MKARVDGLRLAQEQDYSFDNLNHQRASQRSISSNMIDQSQRDLSLTTISEIPTKQNFSLASERIKHAYRKEKAGSSLTHRENKKSIDYDGFQQSIMSARNAPQYVNKNYPHKEINQYNAQIHQNQQLQKYLNKHVIQYQSKTIDHKSPLVSQRDKMKKKKQLSRDISEERLRSLSSHSLDQKCCKGNHGSQKNIDNLRSCSQCSTHFQMNKYEMEEERQKIQYILSVSGSIQNYEMYSNQEISAENKIMSQYVRKFQRYVDFIVQTNALQIEQELEDIDAKLQTQREHLEFYSKQEEKYKLLYNKLQNPFYVNNLSVKADEIKRNTAFLKKEIHNLLSGRGFNKSPRELTAIQKATNLQKEVNIYGALLKERRNKLESLIEQENKLKGKRNPSISIQMQGGRESQLELLQVSQNNSEGQDNQTKLINNNQIFQVKSDLESQQLLNNSQENLKDTIKWNKTTIVTLDTDIESYANNRRDTLIKSQRSSPNPNYISFSQESQPSQLHLESVADEDEHIPIIDKEITFGQNSIIKKQLQKIVVQSPYLNHQNKSKSRNEYSHNINRVTPENRNMKLSSLEKINKNSHVEPSKQIHYQNYLNRRNSMISERNHSIHKQTRVESSTPRNETSLEKENKIKKNFADIDVNLPQFPSPQKRYQFNKNTIDKSFQLKNKSKVIQNNIQQTTNATTTTQVHQTNKQPQLQILTQSHQKQQKLNEQLSLLKNQLAEQRLDQQKQIKVSLKEIDQIKNQCKIQEEKCLQLDGILKKQNNLITVLS